MVSSIEKINIIGISTNVSTGTTWISLIVEEILFPQDKMCFQKKYMTI